MAGLGVRFQDRRVVRACTLASHAARAQARLMRCTAARGDLSRSRLRSGLSGVWLGCAVWPHRLCLRSGSRLACPLPCLAWRRAEAVLSPRVWAPSARSALPDSEEIRRCCRKNGVRLPRVIRHGLPARGKGAAKRAETASRRAFFTLPVRLERRAGKIRRDATVGEPRKCGSISRFLRDREARPRVRPACPRRPRPYQPSACRLL